MGIEEVLCSTSDSTNGVVFAEVAGRVQDNFANYFLASKGRLQALYKNEMGKPTTGLRMDLPNFLKGTHPTLEAKHGQQLQRYVKYEDKTEEHLGWRQLQQQHEDDTRNKKVCQNPAFSRKMVAPKKKDFYQKKLEKKGSDQVAHTRGPGQALKPGRWHPLQYQGPQISDQSWAGKSCRSTSWLLH